MFSAAIPVVEEIVFEDLWPYKREKKPSSKRGRGTQKQGKREQKQSKNPEKEIIHSEKKKGGTEEKKTQKQSKDRKKPRAKKNLHREGNQFCHCFYPCRKRPKQNQYPQKPAPSFVSFIISKSAKKKNKSRPWAQEQKGKAEGKVSSRRKSSTTIPARASPSSPTPLTEQVRGFFFSHYFSWHLHCASEF
jgi:hypothetical protein